MIKVSEHAKSKISQLMSEEGFQVDSSIFPIVHDRYGIPDAEPEPSRIETRAGSIVEFPGTTFRLAGMNMPVGGGGYFRLLPWWLMHSCLQRVERRHPINFYIHPWEIDPDQPRLPGSMRSRLRHYANLRSTTDKLERLLNAFSFAPMTTALERFGLAPEAWAVDLRRVSAVDVSTRVGQYTPTPEAMAETP